jgi:hypothetical protein
MTGCDGNKNPSSDGKDTAPLDVQPDVPLVEAPRFVHIVDAPTEQSRVPCVSTHSPGADIDAARIFSDPTLTQVAATLTQCRWLTLGTRCEDNFHAEIDAAEGKPDGNPVAGFVSLNSGSMVCQWSNNAALSLGMVVQVIEMSSGPDREPYEVQVCHDEDALDCGPLVKSDEAKSTFPAGTLLF